MQIHVLSPLKRCKCEEISIQRAERGIQRQKREESHSFRGSAGPLGESADTSAVVPELRGEHHKKMLIIPFSLFESARD